MGRHEKPDSKNKGKGTVSGKMGTHRKLNSEDQGGKKDK